MFPKNYKALSALPLVKRWTLKATEQHLNAAFVQHLISFLRRSLAWAAWRLFSAGRRCRCSPGRPAGGPQKACRVQSGQEAAVSSSCPGWAQCLPACWCKCRLVRGRNRWIVASKRPFILQRWGLAFCVLPVSTWGVAEWGMVAASWGIELISGSGVLLGGEIASGVITIRGLSCRNSVYVQQITLRGSDIITGGPNLATVDALCTCPWIIDYHRLYSPKQFAQGLSRTAHRCQFWSGRGACVAVQFCAHMHF